MPFALTKDVIGYRLFVNISEEEYIKECPILQYLGNKKKLVINRDILLQMPPSWQDDLVYLLDKMEHY